MTVAWISADWPAPASVVAGTTLRTGGVSRGKYESLNLAAHVGDHPESVAQNRRRFRADCTLPSEPLWLRQVHGTTVTLTSSDAMQWEADAIVSRDSGLVCAVLTADCLPVALTTEDGGEIAVAHAGWRGLAAGILENTVAAMRGGAEEILAWFGPAISQPAFEVGPEVREQFLDRNSAAEDFFSANESGRWQADLYGLATLKLQECGVRRVYGGGLCTHSEPDRFFSYRRDGPCGRMATFVFRNGGT
jgi:YfiH family protein